MGTAVFFQRKSLKSTEVSVDDVATVTKKVLFNSSPHWIRGPSEASHHRPTSFIGIHPAQPHFSRSCLRLAPRSIPGIDLNLISLISALWELRESISPSLRNVSAQERLRTGKLETLPTKKNTPVYLLLASRKFWHRTIKFKALTERKFPMLLVLCGAWPTFVSEQQFLMSLRVANFWPGWCLCHYQWPVTGIKQGKLFHSTFYQFWDKFCLLNVCTSGCWVSKKKSGTVRDSTL